MKKLLIVILTYCLLTVFCSMASAEQLLDLTAYSDEALLALHDDVQSEIANRKIEKTAHLTAGTYIGGRDIPIGTYILTAAGTEGEHGIVSLTSGSDSTDDDPSKLYEHKHGNDEYSVFITIEEGDILELPFPYTLTISAGVMFK